MVGSVTVVLFVCYSSGSCTHTQLVTGALEKLWWAVSWLCCLYVIVQDHVHTHNLSLVLWRSCDGQCHGCVVCMS